MLVNSKLNFQGISCTNSWASRKAFLREFLERYLVIGFREIPGAMSRTIPGCSRGEFLGKLQGQSLEKLLGGTLRVILEYFGGIPGKKVGDILEKISGRIRGDF